MTEQIPQWAVERADDLCAQILERATNTDYGIGVSLDARDLIARALADAARSIWRTDMKNVPFDTTFVVGGWVHDTAGSRWWEEQVVWLDDETGDIAAECECPFNLDDFDHWLPLPDAPEVG